METGQQQRQSSGLKSRAAAGLAIIIAVVLLIRLPFLNQAIQGDDVYYLAGAEHAQIDPLHPNHTRYVFLGDVVDMRGHPHPPLDVWYLALLLAILGDIREVPFHAAYILFSLIAALSMWSLARRFSPHPFWATLLFLAVPAFVINGNSLESDVPFVAFWVAAVALFTGGRLLLAAVTLFLASMTAFQAIFLTPILAVYVWLYYRRSRSAWIVTLVPVATIALWQIYERLSSGVLPAAVLTGYMDRYHWQVLVTKLRNAAALAVHSLWIVFPLLLPPAVLASWKRRDRETIFLASWIAIFFAGALVVFFAGSARYLLPIAAPVCLLVSRIRSAWLAAGFACQMALSLALAVVNYQHWDGYRAFAASLQPYHRIWINGEWGLRYYLESQGGLPLQRGQAVQPGDVVVSSELAYPVDFTYGGGILTRVAHSEIRPAIPLRLIGLDAKSGYSTASKGLRPFDISTGPIDRVHADVVVERRPTLELVPMGAPEAVQQIVSGIYKLEEDRWRWMSGRAVLLLKSPVAPTPLKVRFNIPEASPARRVTLLLDGREIASQSYPAPGSYSLETPPQAANTGVSTLTIIVDKVFTVPGDVRELGIILAEAGFQK
jgi:hypothetical protein